MGKYFGTDGFRGKANETLTVSHAYKIGLYLGNYYSKDGKKTILIGKDTRLSSDMLESGLAAGIMAGGCDALLCGTCPTPMVSYLVRTNHYACGAMISASHNPYHDNGIKLFSNKGEKCNPELENAIEQFIDGIVDIEVAINEKIGQKYYDSSLLDQYCQWVSSCVNIPNNDLKVVIDCANGSSSVTAYKVLKPLVKEVIGIHYQPDGLNINTNCGSTHPAHLCKAVVENKADLGFAFDGDADRLICVNSKGEVITGDHMLLILGQYMDAKNELNDHCVVSTVMANLGFFHALKENNLVSVKTDVGDKYVYEQMVLHNYDLGGEQSGHIIFRRKHTTGDGLLTALHMLEAILNQNSTLDELAAQVTIYPQLLINVKVKDKHAVMQEDIVQQWIAESEASLNGEGRLLVRPSGTEPLVRVMAEAKTEEQTNALVHALADKIKEKYGI